MVKKLKRPIIKIKEGPTKGRKLAIIVGVHGNEKGPQYEWEWLNKLDIISGSLYLIFANPSASESSKRFVNVNLNRRFGKNLKDFPEDNIAREIEDILDDCDASLDLHMYNEPMDRPFVICNSKSNIVAKYLSVEYIVNIPGEVNSGGSDDYMTMSGKIGICFEAGSVDRPNDYSKTIQHAVITFLSIFGLMNAHIVKKQGQKILTKSETKMVESNDIKFTKNYSSFDKLKRGEIICTENGKVYTAKEDGYILFPRPKNPIGTEAYYILTHTGK